MCLAVTENTYTNFIQQGRAVLIKLRELGITQEQVYTPFLQYHNTLEDGLHPRLYRRYIWCTPQWYV